MKQSREKEWGKMLRIIEALGATCKIEELLAIYKSDRSKFYDIRDICDEFKANMKATTPISTIFLRHEDKVIAFSSHPEILLKDNQPIDQLTSYTYSEDLHPIILRHDDDDDDDKIEFIVEMMQAMQEIMEPKKSKKSKKRKASSSSSSSSSDQSFDCDEESESDSDTSVYTENSSSEESK
jgi:hypothetical protein